MCFKLPVTKHHISGLFKLKLFKMPARERDTSLDLGMLMCRETDSLSALRQLIKKHAMTLHEQDEDEDGDDNVNMDGKVFTIITDFHR